MKARHKSLSKFADLLVSNKPKFKNGMFRLSLKLNSNIVHFSSVLNQEFLKNLV